MSIPHAEPLADALLTELTRLWADNARRPFTAGHRALALAIGCSPGSIPRLMAELEDAGRVRRTPHKNRYLLALIDQPDAALIDQSPLIDQSQSAPAATDRSVGHTRRAPHQDATQQSYPQNRVKPACMVIHDQDQEEEESPPDSESSSARAREVVQLMAARKVDPPNVAAILAARPDLTPELWAAELAGMEARGKGIGYLVNTLKRGSSLAAVSLYPPAITVADVREYGDLFVRDSDAAEVAHAA